MGAEHEPQLARFWSNSGAWYVHYGDTRTLAGVSWLKAPRAGAVKRATIRAKRKHVRKHRVEKRAAEALARASEKMTNPESLFTRVKRLIIREDET